MASFTERRTQLDAIAREISRRTGNNNDAIAMFATSESALNALQSTYAGLITEINNEAAANPLDDAIQDQKRLKDKLVADFQAEKTRSTALKNAVNGI